MARGPDFFKLMTAEQISALEEYARHPGKTIDDVAGYLQDQGVPASRSAVGRWRQDFLLWDRQQRAANVARSYLDAARSSDPTAVTEASLRKFEELVLERLMSGDDMSGDELAKLAQAMRAGIGSRKEVIDLRRMQSDAIKAAEAAAKSGKSAVDVVATIKEALGISGRAA
jgi:hypothetical protein